MQDKTKNIIIVILMILVIILLFALGYTIIKKNDKLQEITGIILVADKNYVIIETDTEDYLINDIEGDYEVGDEVTFFYKEKNLNASNTPKSIKIEDEKLIKKASFKDGDSSDDEVMQENSERPTNSNSISTPGKNDSSGALIPNADDTILKYFEELNTEFSAPTIKENVKNGFITVVDFLFYDGAIKGYHFKDLSNSAKLKVLEMALYFDEKIEKYFPGYKESISSTSNKIYTGAKNEIITSYLNVASVICESNDDLCRDAKETFGKIKNTFGLTWSLIKEIASDGLTSLKNWYEIWSGK